MTSRALKQRALLSARRRRWALLAVAMALAIAGYYGAWTPHKAAGLVVIGLDLAEYVKFLPPVASGQIALRREVFYLPLFVASITAGLIAGRRTAPPALRVLAGLAAIPLALAMLPPAWSPAALLQSEYRLQMIGIGVCLLMLAAAIVTRYLPDWLVLIAVGIGCVIAASAPAWGYLQARPAIEAVYRHALPLGWGFWGAAAGFVLGAVLAFEGAIRR